MERGAATVPRKLRGRRGVVRTDSTGSESSAEFAKFGAIPCHNNADLRFLLSTIALTQTTLPPFTVWDALEAVERISPRVPVAYYRVVLRDNCRKAGVNLNEALGKLRVPRQFASG